MTRLDKLRELEAHLFVVMETAQSKDLAALARQYRETLKEIEEIEGAEPSGDEISEILAGRAANGKSGAVRKNRAKVQKQ